MQNQPRDHRKLLLYKFIIECDSLELRRSVSSFRRYNFVGRAAAATQQKCIIHDAVVAVDCAVTRGPYI